MISACKTFLSDKLMAAGVKREPYVKMKDLRNTSAVHLGAVLLENVETKEDGSKTIFYDDDGNKIKRIKRYEQTLTFNVVIGDKDEQSLNVIYEEFLKILGKGLDDGNGNWIDVNISKTEWLEEKDSILKSTIAVQMLVECVGGIYLDVLYKAISSIELTHEIEE